MSERLHVSTHIEKTAGRTVCAMYEDMFGPEQVLLYNLDDTVSRASDTKLRRSDARVDKLKRILFKSPILPLILKLNVAINKRGNNEVTKIDDIGQLDFRVIHGHFQSTKFSGILDNPLTSIIYRNPLDRMVSHYCHWNRTKGLLLQRHPMPEYPMQFEEWAFLPQLQNVQTTAMGGMEIRDFDAVGVTESLLLFRERMRKIHPDAKQSNQLRQLNQNPNPTQLQDLGISDVEGFTRRFKSFHQADYDNYELAFRTATASDPTFSCPQI